MGNREIILSGVDGYEAQIAALQSERDGLVTQVTNLRSTVDSLTHHRDGWDLAWSDEFDQPDGPPLPTKWNVRDKNMGLLEDGAEISKDMVYVKDGIMHIRAEWLDKPYARPKSKWGITQVTHRAGYVDHVARSTVGGSNIFSAPWYRREVCFKTPTGPNTRGGMAAIWGRDSAYREIDDMEAIGYGGTMPDSFKYVKDTAKTTVFSDTRNGSGKKQFRWGKAAKEDLQSPVVPWDGFHTMTNILMPTYAALEIDGVEVKRWTPADNPAMWGADPANRPVHLRMNLHVGEFFAQPDPAHREWTQGLDFQIDYVRIYTPAL